MADLEARLATEIESSKQQQQTAKEAMLRAQQESEDRVAGLERQLRDAQAESDGHRRKSEAAAQEAEAALERERRERAAEASSLRAKADSSLQQAVEDTESRAQASRRALEATMEA